MKKFNKILSYVFLIGLIVSLFGIVNILAQSDKLKVTKAVISDKSVDVTTDILSYTDNKIENDVVFHHLNDFVIYDVTIKNTDSKDYYIKSITDDNNSPFITYEYNEYKDQKIAANSEITIKVKAIYSKTQTNIEDRALNFDAKFKINYSDEDPNPYTFDNINLFLILGLISLIGLVVTLAINHKIKRITPVIVGLLLIPITVFALNFDFIFTLKNNNYNLKDKLKITYDNNGTDYIDVANYGSNIIFPFVPEKEGYHFVGWYTDPIDGEKIDGSTTVLDDMNLYPRYEANELIFDDQTIDTTYNTSKITIDITPATNGTGDYTYSVSSAKDSGDNDVNYFTVEDEKIIVKEGTPAGTYTVVVKAYDNNSLKEKEAIYTFNIGKQTVDSVTNLAIATNGNITWTNSSNATGYEISFDGTTWQPASSGDNFLDELTTTSDNKTVYVKAINSDTDNYEFTNSIASIDVTIYTISFSLNDNTYATLDVNSYNVIAGVSYEANNNVINLDDGRSVTATLSEKTGYTTTFVNWSDPANVVTNDTELIAYFNQTANPYTIVFNKNANDATGSMSNQDMTYDQTANLNTLGYSRTGYTFAGWAESTDGNVVYTDGAEVVNLATSGSKILYAKWNANPLSFPDKPFFLTYSTSAQNLNVDPASNGTGSYTYTKTSGDANITVSTNGSITIPAGLTAGTHTIVITATDDNSGSTKDATYTFNIDKQEVDAPTNLVVAPDGDATWDPSDNATGYEFSLDCTNYASATSGNNFLVELTATDADKTVCVKAVNSDTTNYDESDPISVTVEIKTITFNTNNATYGTVNPTTLNVIKGVSYSVNTTTFNLIDGRTVTASITEKTGYTTTFNTWSTQHGTVNDDLTVTANFNQTANPYTIVFNKNATDATGSMSDQDMIYDVPTNLNTLGYERTGYTFAGWAESTSGNVIYTDGEEVVNLATTGSKILYAKWDANELIFDNNTIDKTYSTSAQTANVVPATNGTGDYSYAKASGDADINVANDGTITIAANTNAGTHTIVITATDNNSGITKDATYTIEIAKQQVNNATNLAVSPVGDATWNESDNATGYEFSYDCTNYVSANSGDNFLNELIADGNDKTVCLKTINNDTENYENPVDPITLVVPIHHVTYNVNDDTYGSVNVSDMFVIDGLTYSVNSNVLTTQDNRTVTATAGTQTGFEIVFVNWSSASGTFNDDTTITANFDRSANDLVFADQSFNKTYSTTLQTESVEPATNGTGDYSYTKKSGDANILVTADGTILLSAGINAGTHTVVITATDNNSGASKDATYTFTIAKQQVNAPTNLVVAPDGDITWNPSSNSTGYEISFDGTIWQPADSGDNFLDKLTSDSNDKIVYLKAVNSDTTNYDESDIVNKNVEIISIEFDYDHNYGTLSLDSLNAIKGVTYYTNSNMFYLSDGRNVTATVKSKDGYTTTFTSWSAHSGTLNDDGFFGAYFTRTANQYSIVFNKNATDATGTMSNQDMTYDQAANLNTLGYERTGYTFAGWAESTDGEVIYLDGAEVNNLVTAGSKILYAKWTANDLVFNDKLINKTYSTSDQTDAVEPATNGTGDYSYAKASGDAGINVANDGTITINAGLNAGTHTVVITATDNNSNATKDAIYTIEVAQQQVNAPTNLTIASNGTITWNDSDNATGYEISFDGTTYTSTTNGSKYLTELTSTSDNKTVYVRAINSDTTNYITPSSDVSKNVTIVTLNTSSNDIEMGNIDNLTLNVIKGATYTTSSNKINLSDGRKVTATAETGYHFVSWSSTSGTINATTNIIATFAPNTDTDYTVNHYVHDLGTNTYTLDSTDNLNGTTGDTLTVADLSKSISGFTYVDGYVTGDTTKPDSGAVTTTTILPDGSRVINLYYRRNYLYIQYDMNGGYLAENHGNVSNEGSLVTNSGGNTLFRRGAYGTKVGNLNTSTYVVTDAGLHDYNNPSSINLERGGYTANFGAEWNTRADGTGIGFDQELTTYDADGFAGVDLSAGDQVVTLYVDWVPLNYSITYNLDGGSQVNPKTSYTVETATFTLVNPTKEGYTFTGWTGSNGDTPQTNVSITIGSTGNQTYTANWTPNTYTIKYNVNTNDDVDGTIADQEMTYDVAANLTASPYNRIYYNFGEWNTEPDGSGTPYTDGQSVSNLATSGVVNLYAQWEDKIVCKRASELHTAVLNDNHAKYYGYTQNPKWYDINTNSDYEFTYQNTTSVVYGLTGTDNTTYTSGDAFTCDVNGDGIFDEETERFYYVNDYFNPNTQSFDSNYATLMYYSMWSQATGEPSTTVRYAYNDDSTQKAIGVEHGYERTRVSPLGPISAVNGLPTKEQWSNIKLANTQRQILSYDNYNYSKSTYWLAEDSETYMYPIFDYSNYTSRLITSQEFINSTCNAGNYEDLEYDVYSQAVANNCMFIYENTDLESGIDTDRRRVYTENPQRRGIYYATWFDVDDYGLELFHSDTVNSYEMVKPSIEIPKKNIDLTINSHLITFVPISDSKYFGETQYKTVLTGNAIGELPLIEKEGYTIEWYTGEDGTGTRITENTVPTSNLTLYPKLIANEYTITYYANGGDFGNNIDVNNVSYKTSILENTKYSYTDNNAYNGYQSGWYGSNWNESNISGSDRGDLSKAHVVSIDGASSITVDVYYNSESPNNDWTTIWEGSHPDYTASANYSSGIDGAQRLGGSQGETHVINGNTITRVKHLSFKIEGNSVTFGFKSNYGNAGDGYGYYAIISGSKSTATGGTYKTPDMQYYNFVGWNTEPDGSGTMYATKDDVENSVLTSATLYAIWEDKVVCRRATTLHTESCDGDACDNYGYEDYSVIDDGISYTYGVNNSAKGTNQVVYGSLGTDSSTFTVGDAFTCDVNGDGIYDEETERFYYVNDYYDTSTNSFDDSYATLVYYNGFDGENPNNDSIFAYADSNNTCSPISGSARTGANCNGPDAAVNYLPSTSNWKNVVLKNSSRQIINEENGTTTHYGSDDYSDSNTYPLAIMNYNNKAARLLTYQELKGSCFDANASVTSNNSLYEACLFLHENNAFTYDSNKSYTNSLWLETPVKNAIYYTWATESLHNRLINNTSYSTQVGRIIKPTIEIPKKNIDLTVRSYKVTFDMNYPTGMPTNYNKPLNYTISCSGSSCLNDYLQTASSPKIYGYEFNGWYTDPVYGESAYSLDPLSSSVTLYAHWIDIHQARLNNNGADYQHGGTYMIYLVYNDGAYLDYNKQYKMTSTENPIVTPTKTGYTFNGYNGKIGNYTYQFIDSNGYFVFSGGAYNLGTSLTLNAEWIPNNYTIEFDNNGGSGTISDLSMTYGISKKLPETGFTNGSLDLVGLNTEPDGSGTYFWPGQVVTNLATNGTIALYAVYGSDLPDAGKIAMMLPGAAVNAKIISLAGSAENVKYIYKSSSEPSAEIKNNPDNNISSTTVPIYMWYDDASNVIYYWFQNNIIYLNEDSSSIFANLPNLITLDIYYLDSSQVSNMSGMFYNDTSLEYVYLTNFYTGYVSNMSGMFANCSNLYYVSVNGNLFVTDNVTSSMGMFYGATSIVGYYGTTYDPNHTDKEYARIDWGESEPGYFN